MMTPAELTIMRAASSIARETALALAVNATTSDEQDCVHAALFAHIEIEKYLEARERADRPF